MNESFKDKVVRYMALVLVFGTLLGGLMIMWPTYLRGQALKRQEQALDAKNAERRAEIARLVDYQRRFKTDRDFIEKIARQNHRVYPGEIVFVFDGQQ